MLEAIETLEVLSRMKTMQKTASYMRITQPTVSKRIATLERELGQLMLERSGKRVQLTREGVTFLEKVRPYLQGIKDCLNISPVENQIKLSIAFSESILATWGARALVSHTKKVDLQIHSHRAPGVIDRLREGEYQVGVIAGKIRKFSDLHFKQIGVEKMYLVRSKKINEKISLPLICTEKSSETWKAIKQDCQKFGVSPNQSMEFFGAIAQLANEGIVEALVPAGIAKILCAKRCILHETNIFRPIVMLARKSVFNSNVYECILDEIESHIVQQLDQVNI